MVAMSAYRPPSSARSSGPASSRYARVVPWSSVATGAALITTRRLVPVARMAARMLAVAADMIEDRCVGGAVPGQR